MKKKLIKIIESELSVKEIIKNSFVYFSLIIGAISIMVSSSFSIVLFFCFFVIF